MKDGFFFEYSIVDHRAVVQPGCTGRSEWLGCWFDLVGFSWRRHRQMGPNVWGHWSTFSLESCKIKQIEAQHTLNHPIYYCKIQQKLPHLRCRLFHPHLLLHWIKSTYSRCLSMIKGDLRRHFGPCSPPPPSRPIIYLRAFFGFLGVWVSATEHERQI